MTARYFKHEIVCDMVNASNWVMRNKDTGEQALGREFTDRKFPGVVWWHIEPGRATPLDVEKKQAGPIWEIGRPAPMTEHELARRVARF